MEFLNKMHRASNERGGSEEYKKPLFKDYYDPNTNKPPEPRESPPQVTPEPDTQTETPGQTP